MAILSQFVKQQDLCGSNSSSEHVPLNIPLWLEPASAPVVTPELC